MYLKIFIIFLNRLECSYMPDLRILPSTSPRQPISQRQIPNAGGGGEPLSLPQTRHCEPLPSVSRSVSACTVHLFGTHCNREFTGILLALCSLVLTTSSLCLFAPLALVPPVPPVTAGHAAHTLKIITEQPNQHKSYQSQSLPSRKCSLISPPAIFSPQLINTCLGRPPRHRLREARRGAGPIHDSRLAGPAQGTSSTPTTSHLHQQ